MSAWLIRILALPYSDDEETNHTATLLGLSLPLAFTLNLIFLIIIWLFLPQETFFLAALLMGLMLDAIALWCLKRGYAQFAAWFVTLIIIGLAGVVAFIIGTDYEAVFITQLVAILFAGLVLGSRAVPVVSGFTLVLWLVALIVHESGLFRLVSDVSVFVFASVFIFWSVHYTEQALSNAHKTATALRDAMAQVRQTTISQTFLDNILQSLADMLVVLDMEGRIVMTNEALLNCLGYERTQLIGEPFNRIRVSVATGDLSMDSLLANAETPQQAESEYRCMSGEIITVYCSCHPLTSEDGQVQGVVCVAQDITEQKRNRQAAAESEKRFLAVAEASEAAVIIANESGILYTNSATERITGWSCETIRQMGLPNLFHEEYRMRVMLLFDKLLHGDAAASQIEARVLNPQDEEKWLYFSAAAAEMDDAPALVITALDISKRKQAEEERMENEALKSAFLEASLDALILTDQEGNVLEYNRAAEEIFGYSRSEAIGQNVNDLIVSEKYRETHSRHLHNFCSGKESRLINQRLEVMAKAKGRREVPIELTVSSIQFGDKILVASYLRDISEQIKAKEVERIANAEKERVRVLSEFVRDSSHDFRTPLSSINTSLYLMQRTNDEHKRNDYAMTIIRQTARLEKLIEGMITMVQLESDTEFMPQSIDMNGLIRDICVRIRSLASAKNQEIILDLEPDLPHISAVGHQIGRTITELLENAVIFTSPGGEIHVRTGVEDQTMQIEIRDNGIGISEENLPNIFNRFYRVDISRSTETGGVGLGLPIAQKIAQQHGGRIAAESVLGHGSTFRVFLPVQHDPEAVQP
ncbi:MAG: PAS domain S-box protein [Anaerolineaceae bacterium]|nr:PAS domain S-box protein [Anaerolineaceae bacterium]